MLKRYASWSLRYKLLVVLLQFGITAFAVTGAISYIKHLRSLRQNAINQLTSIRRAKAYQLESYYRTIHRHALSLSDDQMFIEAIKEFRSAYRTLNTVPVPPDRRSAVVEYYRSSV